MSLVNKWIDAQRVSRLHACLHEFPDRLTEEIVEQIIVSTDPTSCAVQSDCTETNRIQYCSKISTITVSKRNFTGNEDKQESE